MTSNEQRPIEDCSLQEIAAMIAVEARREKDAREQQKQLWIIWNKKKQQQKDAS